MLEKVISGGQTGVDRIGLLAARHAGYKTGGYAPKGFKTEKGKEKELLTTLGLTETSSPDYKYRTEMNVMWSDCTIIFGDETSVGSKLTIELCKKWGRPYRINPVRDNIIWLIVTTNAKILNVAGNRGSKLGTQYKKELFYSLLETFIFMFNEYK